MRITHVFLVILCGCSSQDYLSATQDLMKILDIPGETHDEDMETVESHYNIIVEASTEEGWAPSHLAQGEMSKVTEYLVSNRIVDCRSPRDAHMKYGKCFEYRDLKIIFNVAYDEFFKYAVAMRDNGHIMSIMFIQGGISCTHKNELDENNVRGNCTSFDTIKGEVFTMAGGDPEKNAKYSEWKRKIIINKGDEVKHTIRELATQIRDDSDAEFFLFELMFVPENDLPEEGLFDLILQWPYRGKIFRSLQFMKRTKLASVDDLATYVLCSPCAWYLSRFMVDRSGNDIRTFDVRGMKVAMYIDGPWPRVVVEQASK